MTVSFKRFITCNQTDHVIKTYSRETQEHNLRDQEFTIHNSQQQFTSTESIYDQRASQLADYTSCIDQQVVIVSKKAKSQVSSVVEGVNALR